MPIIKQLIAFYTIVRKDVCRMFRIWKQTFLPCAVTAVLYFLIFGTVLGKRIGDMEGFSYISFVVPGLIMLNVITCSYSNVAYVFFMMRYFVRTIDEILITPTHPFTMVSGFITGGIIRGLLTAFIVYGIALIFAPVAIAHPLWFFVFIILASLLFGLAGFLNAVYADSFDSIEVVPTFLLTPLIYLGGVFYSITILPPFLQHLTYANPIFYIINGFRYSLLGVSDVSLYVSLAVLIILDGILLAFTTYVVRSGMGLKA